MPAALREPPLSRASIPDDRATGRAADPAELADDPLDDPSDDPSDDPLIAEAARLALRWCRRLGGPGIDPDDAAQDVLLVVLRRRQDLRDPADLSRWVWGITRKVVSAHRRRAWFRRWIPGKVVEPEAPAWAEDGELRAVMLLIETLSEVQREVFVLVRIEGQTMPEVARLLDIPEGTARSRLRLARASMRAKIESDPRFSGLKGYLEDDDG